MIDIDDNDAYVAPSGLTPLDHLRHAFTALLAATDQPALPGAELGCGLPERDIPLSEMKMILMSQTTAAEAKRAIWTALVQRCRAGMPEWIFAATGLAYPGLAGQALRICQAAPGDRDDIQGELLLEFVEALYVIDTCDPDIADIAGWLCSRAVTTSRKAREALDITGTVATNKVPESAAPSLQVSHPDIVLARAVRLGVLAEKEADMIARLFLENQPVGKVARDTMPRGRGCANRTKTRGISEATFYRYRNEVTGKLAAAIESGILRSY
ncbi:hypothetical protein ABH935_007058 [Catenulispora sp. GAS73]|uniref:hypothetical protein n=1 Tax=Catenulispora sp. GAS73 TaxID=3156269 RepID=UPI0035199E24